MLASCPEVIDRVAIICKTNLATSSVFCYQAVQETGFARVGLLHRSTYCVSERRGRIIL